MAINRAKVSRAAEKFVRQGRLKEAIREYRRLLDDSSDDVGVLNKIGDLYRQTGQDQRALACYVRIAEHYRDRGFAQKAIAMYKKVAKLDEAHAEVREQLAALYGDSGLTRDALQNLREAARLYAEAGEQERALELESRALELCPDDWAGLRVQAQRLQAAGEGERAQDTFLRAARGLATSGDIEGALSCCREAAGAAPLSPEPVSLLIRLLVEHGRAKEAIDDLRQRLQDEPQPHLQALLGETLLAQGDTHGAREALEAARDSAFAAGDPRYKLSVVRLDLVEGRLEEVLYALEHLVGILVETGAARQAAILVDEVLERQPGSEIAQALLLDLTRDRQLPAEQLELHLLHLAGCLEEGRHAEALPGVLQRLLQIRPHDAELAERLAGLSQEEMALPEDGAGAADGETVRLEGEDGSDVDPEFVGQHLVEADVFIKYGLTAKAAAHLNQIIQRYPRTMVAHQRLVDLYRQSGQADPCLQHSVLLAEAHRQRGETDEALAVLGRAQELEPDNHSLEEMRRALRRGDPLPAFRPTYSSRPPATPRPAAAPGREGVKAVSAPAAPAPSRPPVASVPPRAPEPTAAKTSRPEEEVLELVLDDGLLDDAALASPTPQPAADMAAGAVSSPAPQPAARTAAPPARQAPAGADDFFDLAEAIERELDEEPDAASDPVVDDDSSDDTVTGIRRAIQDQVAEEDHQTHYQLGIAFKEMGMLDEAISAFQQASRDADSFLICCSMLGLCFREKNMPQIAEKWYRKGLDQAAASRGDDDQMVGLLYDLGVLQQEQGRLEEARACFTEVYASQAGYRDVAARLRVLSPEAELPGPQAGR